MKLIKPSFSILNDTNYNIESIYKRIELVGRCSHKSEDKITEDSAKTFVDRMIKLRHYAPLEFGTVYLQFFWPGTVCQRCNQTAPHKLLDKYANNKYSIVRYHGNDVYVTANLRILVENNWLDDLKYLCEPTEYHEKRYTVKFTLPIGISREFVRHRAFSFMELSTRYVNMSGNKVGNEITFISPNFKPDFIGSPLYLEWIGALRNAEKSYNNLIKLGYKPQEARGVLPLDTKTELYMCGYIEDWKHFFELRDDKQHAHPQAYELAHPLHEEFIRLGLINN